MSIRSNHWRLTWPVFGLFLVALASESRAQAESRLFLADDFHRLAEGVALPHGGRYIVKVWAPANQRWELAADPSTLTISSRTETGEPTPRWEVLGSANIKADESIKVVVKTLDAKGISKDQASAGAAARPPVPGALWLSTDPDLDPNRALENIRARLDTVAPSEDPRRTHVRTNGEGANFRAPLRIHDWRERARAVRQQLLVTLGLWPMFPKTPLNPQVFGKIERDGYTVEKVVLETLPGFTLSGNLYRPKGDGGRRPALLCPHGHAALGRVDPDCQHRCIRWAKLGCVVFTYDMVGFNDSKPFGHKFLDDRLRRWGLSLATLQTWNSIRALDWLTARADVDPARIGCTGESGGGTQTFLLTAIDDRIRVAAPVVMVSDSFQGGCACENAAGLRLGTDNVEFAALAAPRPLKLVGATGDWTALTMSRAFPTLRDVYALNGLADRVSADVFDFPHNYNQTSRNAVYAFMGKWLLGINDAARTREGEQKPEPIDDLLTSKGSSPVALNVKTAEEIESDLVAGLGRQIASLAPSANTASWQAARNFLLTSLRIRVGFTNPVPSELLETELRRTTRDGLTIVHSRVGRKASGEQVPVVVLVPAQPNGRATVIATAHGKRGLFTPEGQARPLAKELLAHGQTVVGFDPLFVGESFDPSSPAERRPDTAHFETYNPSLAADQMQDLATVVAWVRERPEIREVNLVGQGRAGVQALLARPRLEGIGRTAIDLREFNAGDGSTAVPAYGDLPGLLQFGGVKAAAALTAPGPLWIYRVDESFERAWPEKAYALADATRSLRIDRDRPSPEVIARWIDEGIAPSGK
jgi:dienelactone hydrolase